MSMWWVNVFLFFLLILIISLRRHLYFATQVCTQILIGALIKVMIIAITSWNENTAKAEQDASGDVLATCSESARKVVGYIEISLSIELT